MKLETRTGGAKKIRLSDVSSCTGENGCMSTSHIASFELEGSRAKVWTDRSPTLEEGVEVAVAGRIKSSILSAIAIVPLALAGALPFGSANAGIPPDTAGRVAQISKEAARGDANAAYELGAMYEHGYGVPKDDKRAWMWYTKSAARGNTNAQNNLGVMCLLGYEFSGNPCFRAISGSTGALKVTAESDAAVRWFKKAAMHGNMYARFNLGVIYAWDKPEEAVGFWRKSASQGDTEAAYALGWLYEVGNKDKGFPSDVSRMLVWLQNAARAGDAKAETTLGYVYQVGAGVREDHALAMSWSKKAAVSGNPTAEANLGFMYFEMGQGSLAVKWLMKAAAQGNAAAKSAVGELRQEVESKQTRFSVHEIFSDAGSLSTDSAQEAGLSG